MFSGRVQSVEHEVSGMGCRVWSVECEVWSVECGIQVKRVECEVWTARRVWSMKLCLFEVTEDWICSCWCLFYPVKSRWPFSLTLHCNFLVLEHVHYIICCFYVVWGTTCPTWCQSPGEQWKKNMDHQHPDWKNEGSHQHQRLAKKVKNIKGNDCQMENDKRKRIKTHTHTRIIDNDKIKPQKDRKNNDKKKNTKLQKESMKRVRADPPRSIGRLPAGVCKATCREHEMGTHFPKAFLLGCSLLCAFALPKDGDFNGKNLCRGSVWIFLSKQASFGSPASFSQMLASFQSDFSACHENWGPTFWVNPNRKIVRVSWLPSFDSTFKTFVPGCNTGEVQLELQKNWT